MLRRKTLVSAKLTTISCYISTLQVFTRRYLITIVLRHSNSHDWRLPEEPVRVPGGRVTVRDNNEE